MTNSLQLGVELYGNGWEATETQSRTTGVEVGGRYDRALDETVRVHVAASAQAEAGVARSRANDEFRPKQLLRLEEASLAWTPAEWLTLTGGSLDQDRWNSPLLLQRRSFPAALERLAVPLGDVTASLSAMQAIASDTSSVQRWGNWENRFPTFSMERAELRWKPSSRFEVTGHISHFLFDSLSHGQAYDAQFLGNSVRGLGPENAVFQYGFQGFEAGVEVHWRLSGAVEAFVQSEALQNRFAPKGHSVAYRNSIGALCDVSPTMILRPAVGWFHSESDASPAFFNSRLFGHNNREGWGVSLGAGWPKSRVSADVQYVQSSVISPNPLQSSAQWIQATLRMDYDAL